MPATASQIARHFGVSAKAVRQWPGKGCPVVRRDRPMLFDLPAVAQWRSAFNVEAQSVERVAVALLETLQRDCGVGSPAHVARGVDTPDAAAILLVAFDRAHWAISGREPKPPFPPPIEQLRRIAGL